MVTKKSKVRYFAEIRRSGALHNWEVFSELSNLNAAKLFLSQNSRGVDFVRVTVVSGKSSEVFYT